MKPEELVSLAAAHGIDIAHTVASSTNLKGAAAKRPRTRDEVRGGLEVVETAEGKETRVTRPRYWTHAEVGMGAAGCKRLPWLAACYSFAGDRDRYAELHRGLTLETMKAAERNSWPWQVQLADGRRGFYIERLAEMVLDEDACRPAFTAAPGLYAVYMGVTTRIWHKPLWGYFLTVQERYTRWLDIARGTIGQKLRSSAREDVAAA